MAAALEASGEFRVLRKLKPREAIVPPPGTPIRQGLLVDVETTGLDTEHDEIIELAIPFELLGVKPNDEIHCFITVERKGSVSPFTQGVLS